MYGAAGDEEAQDRGASRPGRARQLTLVLSSVVALALAAACLVVWSADLRGHGGGVLLQRRGGRGVIPKASKDAGREQQLWFGPGISDQLSRYVRIGKGMSARLENNLKRGLEEQSRMVHFDSFHQGEVGHASLEDDLWRDAGGNNNGGNAPCMKDPGECP